MAKDNKLKRFLREIDWKNHLLGFLSVLIGVLVAFGLNDWNENKKLQKGINNALVNLRTEIEVNLENVKKTQETNRKQQEYLLEMYEILDDDLQLTVPDSVILKMYSEIFEIPEDSIESLGVEVDLYSPSDVAFNTFKEAEILSHIDFNLAITLADTYITQQKLSDLDDDIIDEARLLDEGKENVRKTIRTLSISDQLVDELINEHYRVSIDSINKYLIKHNYTINIKDEN